jgi:hypothetical protein
MSVSSFPYVAQQNRMQQSLLLDKSLEGGTRLRGVHCQDCEYRSIGRSRAPHRERTCICDDSGLELIRLQQSVSVISRTCDRLPTVHCQALKRLAGSEYAVGHDDEIFTANATGAHALMTGNHPLISNHRRPQRFDSSHDVGAPFERTSKYVLSAGSSFVRAFGVSTRK